MKPKINIDQIKLLKESYQAPEGYFDSLVDRINSLKDESLPPVKIEELNKPEESYQVPEEYFDGLMEKIEERKGLEDNVVAFRSKRIRIWGSFVAAACIALVVVSVINFGKGPEVKPFVDGSRPGQDINVTDSEIALLLEDNDDEFDLTEEEIIDVLVHENIQSESTAIIDFLEDEGGLEDEEEEDFLESI